MHDLFVSAAILFLPCHQRHLSWKADLPWLTALQLSADAHCLHPPGSCSPPWPDRMPLPHSRWRTPLFWMLLLSSLHLKPCQYLYCSLILGALHLGSVSSRKPSWPLLASSNTPILRACSAHLCPGIIGQEAGYLHRVRPSQEPGTFPGTGIIISSFIG